MPICLTHMQSYSSGTCPHCSIGVIRGQTTAAKWDEEKRTSLQEMKDREITATMADAKELIKESRSIQINGINTRHWDYYFDFNDPEDVEAIVREIAEKLNEIISYLNGDE